VTCSLKQHIQAVKGSFPVDLRRVLREGAPGDVEPGPRYSLRKYLSYPVAPVIDGPSGNNVPLQGVVIQWHDPVAALCNAAARFTVTLAPNQNESIPGVAAPVHTAPVGYDLYYETRYTVSVVGSNAAGSESSQSTFRTATQPAPIDLSPDGIGGVNTMGANLTWIDPGVVPATRYQITIRDMTHSYIKPISVTISQTAYQVTFQMETDTEYSWSVQSMYPGNTSFGPTAGATFTTVGTTQG
jgi:hypothetical protein